MRRLALAAGLATARVASGPAKAVAQAVVGQPAPAFTLMDSNGGVRSLVDLAGRTIAPSRKHSPR